MTRLIALAVVALAVLTLISSLNPGRPAEAANRVDSSGSPADQGQNPELVELPKASPSGARAEPTAEQDSRETASTDEDAVLLAAENEQVLLIRTVDEQGAPVPGAHVGVVFDDRRIRSGVSGKDAIARIDAEDSAHGEGALVLGLHKERGLVSDELRIQVQPAATPIELLLHNGARVEFVVLESEGGAVVPDCALWVDSIVEESPIRLRRTTDSSGRATAEPVGVGSLHWHVGAPGSEHNVRGVLDVVDRGTHEVLVHLDQGGEPLAVEGRFVDAQGEHFDGQTIGTVAGYPSLMIGPDLSQLRPVHADAYGRFRYHRATCEELLVMTNLGGTGHVYAPERLTVPFGTRGLEFRLSRSFEERTLTVECFDADSGAVIEHPRVDFYRHDPGLEQETTYRPTKRTGHQLHLTVLAIADLRYVASARGYIHHHGRLDDLLRDGGRIELTRGQRAQVTVIDAHTEAPIAGARLVLHGREQVAVTNEQGQATLEGKAFDGRLEVQAEGYVKRRWYASWPGRLVPMSPLR